MLPPPPDASDRTSAINCLKVRLFRRPASLPDRPPNGPTNFWVWGYFDWLEMDWRDTSLAEFYNDNVTHIHDEAEPIETRREPYFYEEQFLCAYTHDPRGNIIHSDKPLLTITEVKLDDTVLQKIYQGTTHNTYQYCKKHLEKCLEKMLPPDCGVEYQVFNSLGFSDYIIIFRSHSFQPVFDALFAMKNGDIKRDKYLVKSCYSVYGIDKNCIAQWRDAACQRVSIKLSLKPGANLEDLRSGIEQALILSREGDASINPIDHPTPTVKAEPLFGEYDTEIVIENEQATVSHSAQFFHGENENISILRPGASFRTRLINYTETRWDYPTLEPRKPYSWPISLSSNGKKPVKIRSVSPSAKQLEFVFLEEWLDKFDSEYHVLWAAVEFIIQKNKASNKDGPHSLSLGLRDIMKIYWQIAHNGTINTQLLHQIHRILKILLTTIICDMGVDRAVVTAALERGSFAGVEVDHPCEENSFEKAIYLLSELLQNWIQATRMVLESPIYNIRFINSSAKIYICYNEIVEIIERAFSRHLLDSGERNTEFDFCTMIHHADKIKSELLFPDADPPKRFIPIRLDRNSFFSPARSLSFVAHEIGHYISCAIGERNRAFCETICFDIARSIIRSVLVRPEYGYLFEMRFYEWTPKALSMCGDIQQILSAELDGEEPKPGSSDDLDYQDPNFERFSSTVNRRIAQAFGYDDLAIQTAKDRFVKTLQAVSGPGIDPRQRKRMIDLIPSLETDIRAEKPKTFAAEFFESEMRTIHGHNEIQVAWEALNQTYQQKRKKLETLAEKISTILLKGMNAGDERNPSLISLLIDSAETTGKKKALAHFFSDRQIHENSQWNQEAVQKFVLADLAKSKFQWIVEMYYDIFIETTADMMMIKTFDLSPDDYRNALNNSTPSNDSRDPRKGLAPVQNTRKHFIFINWDKLAKQSAAVTKRALSLAGEIEKANKVIDIYPDPLIAYLQTVSQKLNDFCMEPDIQDLLKQYKSLRSKHHKSAVISKEIAFVEYFCNKYMQEES